MENYDVVVRKAATQAMCACRGQVLVTIARLVAGEYESMRDFYDGAEGLENLRSVVSGYVAEHGGRILASAVPDDYDFRAFPEDLQLRIVSEAQLILCFALATWGKVANTAAELCNQVQMISMLVSLGSFSSTDIVKILGAAIARAPHAKPSTH